MSYQELNRRRNPMTTKKTMSSSGEKPSGNCSPNDQFRKLAVNLGVMNLDLDPDPVILDRLVNVLGQLPDGAANKITRSMANAAETKNKDPEDFLKKYNISKAEGRLLFSLIEGVSVIQHAENLKISINTARSHMRRLLEKTGASGQLDLVRMFLG